MSNFQLTRRQTLAALAGAAFTGEAAAQASAADADVVIVGAGSAGLSAAQTLIGLKRKVIVVEAMGRIGGRAFCEDKSLGAPFDHGCAWLHAADRNPYKPIGEKLGFTLQDHDYELEAVNFSGRGATKAELAKVVKEEERITAQIQAAAARGLDVAASTVAATPTKEAKAAATYVGPMDWGTDLKDMSTADYAAGADLHPNMLCKEGFGAIVARHFADIPVRTGTPVRRIRHAGAAVQVETDAGAISARAVIVTASTGALAAETIKFDPPLPDWKQQAIADLPMGLLAKIPLKIKDGERFGVAPFSDILVERPGRGDCYFLSFPFNYDIMVGFVGGSFAWELTAAGQDAAVDFATNRLVDLFGSNAAAKVDKGLLTAWGANPWIRGGYTAAAPGRFAARTALARTVSGRLFFAGEALGGDLDQTCAGAYNSGRTTAMAVEAALAAADKGLR